MLWCLGGGVELIWTLDRELRAASAAAAAGGLLAAMGVLIKGLLSRSAPLLSIQCALVGV